MKKFVMSVTVLLLISIPCVVAGTGSLRISPALPVMLESPAVFTMWSQDGDAYDVNILLVITQECYDGMEDGAGDVVTVHCGTTLYVAKSHFAGVSGMGGVYVPDSGATTGARYEVSSLKDHLDNGLSEPLDADDIIYWDLAPIRPFDGLTLTSEPEDMTVTLNSDEPRMLIYLMGKSEETAELLDMRVPPTIPGFVVPEVAIGTIMTAGAMFAALGLFAYKKRHTSTI